MYLREGCAQDLPQIADISSEALWNDEIVKYLAPFREQYPQSHRDHYLHLVRKRYFGGDRLLVVVLDGDKSCERQAKDYIVGFAFWSNLSVTSSGSSARPSFFSWLEHFSLWLEGQARWYLYMDRSFDKRNLSRFWQLLGEQDFFDVANDCVELEMLCVRNHFQRQGIGTMLLDWGLKEASRHDMPVKVAATSCGRALYEKHGFVETRQLHFEAGQFTWSSMTWHPPK